MLIRISRPRRGSLALVLLHAWAWLEKLFWGPEAGQPARKEKKIFRPQKVLFSIARGRSAGKEGKTTFQAPASFIFYRQRPASRQGRKKQLFQAPKSFIFYRQRPVSKQGRNKNFSGPQKFYFLSPEAGQQARKEKQLFRPQKVLFSIARGRSAGKEKNFSGPKKFYFLSPEAGQQARKEQKLFRPQKVLFSIARGRSAGKEGKTTFQAPKSFYFLSPEAGQQARKKTFQAPKSFIFYRQRPVSRQGRNKNFSGPKKFYFLSPEAGQQARKEKQLFRPQKSFIFYRQRPASWVDGCRSSRIQSCSRRALHLCDNVRDITTQAQEAQRPIRLRFKKSPARDRGSWKKTFRKLKCFFPWGWTLERRPTSYFLPSN